MDLYPVISSKTIPSDWNYSQSVKQGRAAADDLRNHLGAFAVVAWQAYQKSEKRPGPKKEGEFNFKDWCDDVNIPRSTAMDIIRRFDPDLDQKMTEAHREKTKPKIDAETAEDAEVVAEEGEDPSEPVTSPSAPSEAISLPSVELDDDVWKMVEPLSTGITRTVGRLRTFYSKCDPVMELAKMLERIDKKLLQTWQEPNRGSCAACEGIGCGQGDGTCGRYE